MLKFGVLRLFAILIFGVAIPFGLYRLGRVVGLPLMIAAAIALGLAYGALKADNPWSGDGLAKNLRLVAISAAALAAYVGLSVAAARAVAKHL
jgi:hypothetical protein